MSGGSGAPPPAPPAQPPPPAEGSPCHFALLYSPATARSTLATLLALANEISAGATRRLDHALAHVRLDWWRGEAERYARGEPQHPWLRALLAQDPDRRLNLQRLVEAAATDLATDTLGGRPAGALQRALFELAGTALRAPADSQPPSPQLQRVLGDLGERAGELERFAYGRSAPVPHSAASAPPPAAAPGADSPAAALEALRREAEAIDRALQPRLTPLLVWIALAARQAQRRTRRAPRSGGSGLDGFADNMIAWRAARRAARGRFRID